VSICCNCGSGYNADTRQSQCDACVREIAAAKLMHIGGGVELAPFERTLLANRAASWAKVSTDMLPRYDVIPFHFADLLAPWEAAPARQIEAAVNAALAIAEVHGRGAQAAAVLARNPSCLATTFHGALDVMRAVTWTVERDRATRLGASPPHMALLASLVFAGPFVCTRDLVPTYMALTSTEPVVVEAEATAPWSAKERVDVLLSQRGKRLVVEVDSMRWHGSESAMETDRRRDREALRVGARVLRYMAKNITASKARCAVEIMDAAVCEESDLREAWLAAREFVGIEQ